jgi:hypothetical protein
MSPARGAAAGLALAAALGLGVAAASAGKAGGQGAGKPAAAKVVAAGEIHPVAAGLHDGHAFAPRLSPDGKQLAYGIAEPDPAAPPGSRDADKLRWYVRSLEEETFRTVWPNQHPAFEEGEGTASFTDLVDFRWNPGGRHNAMVARHRSRAEELLLELIKVRVGGDGRQQEPAFNASGSRVAAVSLDAWGSDLWVSDVQHDARPQRLTWTRGAERWPAFHPDGQLVAHEVRDDVTGRADLFVYDLATWSQWPVLRLEPSDEIRPVWSADGKSLIFLSNLGDPAGNRYDLYQVAATPAGAPAAAASPKPERLLAGVRVAEAGRGFCVLPKERLLLAIADPGTGPRLVSAPVGAAGSNPVPVAAEPGPASWDPRDIDCALVGGRLRLAWTAEPPPETRATRPWRLAYWVDVDPAALRASSGHSTGSDPP